MLRQKKTKCDVDCTHHPLPLPHPQRSMLFVNLFASLCHLLISHAFSALSAFPVCIVNERKVLGCEASPGQLTSRWALHMMAPVGWHKY